MSDDRQGLGTTTVLPPAGPGRPPTTGTSAGPPPPPPRRGVPVWLVVVLLIAVAAIVAGAVWMMRGSTPSPARTPSRSTIVTTPEASTEPSAPAESTPAVGTTAPKPKPKPAGPPPVPATVKNPALVTKVTWSASTGYRITVDYIQILTGKAAADAATAAGQESPPPNDYFILNDSKKLRTFSLPKSSQVVVLGWAGAGATTKKALSVGQFMDIMTGGTNPQPEWAKARYYVTVEAGTTVTRIEQIFFP